MEYICYNCGTNCPCILNIPDETIETANEMFKCKYSSDFKTQEEWNKDQDVGKHKQIETTGQ